MLNRIAIAVSVIMNPFLLTVVSTLIIAPIYAATLQQALIWSLIVILFVSVLPSLFILALFQSGKVSSLNLAVKEQRLKPLSFSLLSALAGVEILRRMNAPQEITWLCIAYAINGVIFILITPLWKISFHTGVAAGCVTTLTLLVDVNFAWLGLILPLIAWARVHRKRHTIFQTVVAMLIAIASTATLLQVFTSKL